MAERPLQVDPLEKLSLEMYDAVVVVYMILNRRGETKEGCQGEAMNDRGVI